MGHTMHHGPSWANMGLTHKDMGPIGSQASHAFYGTPPPPFTSITPLELSFEPPLAWLHSVDLAKKRKVGWGTCRALCLAQPPKS